MIFWAWIVLMAKTVQAPPGIITGLNPTNSTVQNVFNVALSLAGAVAVAFIVYGGIKYSLSQGDTGQVKQAKDTILYALIGIVVVMISFLLVNLVIGKF